MRHSGPFRTIAVAALAALMTIAAGAEAPGDPAAVAAALVAKPPRILSEFEAIVGPMHRDPTKWDDAVGPLHRVSPSPGVVGVVRADVELAIDTYHNDPYKELDPSLWHWDLDFLSGRDACQRLLTARFPKARELRVEGRRVLRFGDFYLTPLDAADGFRLSWYEREPLFAIPLRSASETAKLIDALAAIAHAGFTRKSIEAHLGALTLDRGWNADFLHTETWDLRYEPAGAAKPKRLLITFKRPFPSRDLLPKLGIRKPAVSSGDSHMRTRTIFDQAKSLSPDTGYPLPAVGGYAVSIKVDPHGLIDTKALNGFSPVWSAEGAQVISLEALAPWLPGHIR
jgi:hypothetical protein